MDPQAFRRELRTKGEKWVQEMLDEGAWDEQRVRVARNWLEEQKHEAAEKAHMSFREGGTFWVTIGLLAATVALVAFAWIALSGSPLF